MAETRATGARVETSPVGEVSDESLPPSGSMAGIVTRQGGRLWRVIVARTHGRGRLLARSLERDATRMGPEGLRVKSDSRAGIYCDPVRVVMDNGETLDCTFEEVVPFLKKVDKLRTFGTRGVRVLIGKWAELGSSSSKLRAVWCGLAS